MRILILSTNTPHHVYFINRIAAGHKVTEVFYETEHISFPFPTDAPYAAKETQFEQEHFFKDVPCTLPVSLPVHTVSSVNKSDSVTLLQSHQADLVLVFGCGKIQSHIVSLFPKGMINIHRGIASEYRGLDCDLWPIYHEDFENMGVALHYIAEGLDTGDVIVEKRLSFGPHDHIAHIRYHTTVMATDMMREVLTHLAQGKITRRVPPHHGRYYSAMPSVLKALCEKKFDRYIAKQFGHKEVSRSAV